MLRAAIFDFNGVIVDDEPIHFELFQRVLEEDGIGLTEQEYYARYLGFDDRGAFTAAYRDRGRSLSEQKLAALVERKAAYYQEAIRTHTRVFPGVKRLVSALAQEIPLAVASGALRHEIEMVLSSVSMREHFSVIVSAEDVERGKPEPEIFRKALTLLNLHLNYPSPIKPADCLVIEDSKEGIRAASRAGMKCLAVANSHPPDQLTDATAVVNSLKAVSVNSLKALWA